MATLFGVVLIAGGIAILAIVRPWQRDDDDDDSGDSADDDAQTVVMRLNLEPSAKRPSPRGTKPSAGPRPGPKPAAAAASAPPATSRRHRVETISRARRVPPAPGREEIMLPEWLGPVSGPR